MAKKKVEGEGGLVDDPYSHHFWYMLCIVVHGKFYLAMTCQSTTPKG